MRKRPSRWMVEVDGVHVYVLNGGRSLDHLVLGGLRSLPFSLSLW